MKNIVRTFEKLVSNKNNNSGMSLIAVLIFVFVLVSIGIALLTMASNDTKLSTLQRESTRAFYLAESGIEKALWYLNFSSENTEGLGWRGSIKEDGDNSNEYFETKFITPDEVDENGSTIATLVSTGVVDDGSEYSKGTRTIKVSLIKGVAPSPGMTYNHAILTDGDLTFNGGISIYGNIHSNGYLTNNGSFTYDGGVATALTGTNDPALATVNNEYVTPPMIDWDYYKSQVIDPDNPDLEYQDSGNGIYYGAVTSVVFNTPDELVGIHFVDGDVTIKTEILLNEATIFATGTITVLGNGDVELANDISVHPLALIAKGDITIGGSVHGEGIIQSTDGNVTNNGNVNIQEGAIYAKDGVFNGGGGVEFNVHYATILSEIYIPGIGVEVWKKLSWQEI